MTIRSFVGVLVLCAIMLALAPTGLGAEIASLQIYGLLVPAGILFWLASAIGVEPSWAAWAIPVLYGALVLGFAGWGTRCLVQGEPERARSSWAVVAVLLSIAGGHLIAAAGLPELFSVPGRH